MGRYPDAAGSPVGASAVALALVVIGAGRRRA
jgi:hypothetical protein